MNTVHSSKMRALIATLIGMSAGGALALPSRSEPSEAQKRRIAMWEADAPSRTAEAREIAAWNAGVKRRNQRFVRRQLARGRSAQ